MIAKSTQEYDAFGPWVYEIKGEHTMPPLFEKYYKENEQPLMLIKIPRKIDRRDAKPDMHLYDYVIAALNSHLYILKRVNDNVEEMKLAYCHIIAVQNAVALLQGKMILYLYDANLIIGYNAVSEDIMMRLINIIRQKYNTQEKKLAIETLSHDINHIDHRYSVLINQYKEADDKVRLVAYQPPMKPIPQGLLKRMAVLLSKKKLISATAFATNDLELIVLQREKRIRTIKQGDVSYSALFLPYKSITNISRTQETDQNTLGTLNIFTGVKAFSYLYGDNNRQIGELFNALQSSVL